jgi:hypothetical protein
MISNVEGDILLNPLSAIVFRFSFIQATLAWEVIQARQMIIIAVGETTMTEGMVHPSKVEQILEHAKLGRNGLAEVMV